MIILGFAGVGFPGVSNEEQDGAERRVGNSIDFGRPPSRSFCLAVPDLTRSADIQLNERVSLRRPLEILSSA